MAAGKVAGLYITAPEPPLAPWSSAGYVDPDLVAAFLDAMRAGRHRSGLTRNHASNPAFIKLA